jgi:hypothetical protein
MLELLHCKSGVNRDGVHPMMWAWLGAVAVYHFELTEKTLWVTSLRRNYVPGHASRHSPKPPELATAADIRRHALDAIDYAAEFCSDLQRAYGTHIGVVLEPEWLTRAQLAKRFGTSISTPSQERAARARVGPHIHLQLKGTLWSP